MEKFKYLEHPADIKIRSFGQSLQEAFINAALGMMDFIYGDLSIDLEHSEKIIVEGSNRDSLLVNWLSEILWLSDTHHRAYLKYDIQSMTDQKMIALVQSGPAKAKEDIKAVTYHELDIQQADHQWTITVVYDI